LILAAALLLQEPPAGDTIVVTAERSKCTVRLADKPLSDPEFAAHAAEWAAGRPLRVYAPHTSDHDCLAQIVFKLNKKGVRVIHFADGGTPPGDPNWGPPDKP
jgi:hypothetical protein